MVIGVSYGPEGGGLGKKPFLFVTLMRGMRYYYKDGEEVAQLHAAFALSGPLARWLGILRVVMAIRADGLVRDHKT